MNVLCIGGGLTGSVLSSILNEQLNGKVQLECWDKARGVGGRMSTSRAPWNELCTADLGAQYFSLMPEYAVKHKTFHDELIDAKILRPITATIEGESSHPVVIAKAGEGTRNFSAANGSNTIVKYWFKKAGIDVKCNRTVTRLDVTENDQWRVSTQTGEDGVFDAVILTIPTPQILGLQGDIADIIAEAKDLKSRLENVSYSSRYASGLFYKSSLDLPWTAKYVYGNPCIRFLAVDTKKRGIESGPSSVVVHTSVPFGLKHLEDDKEVAGKLVLEHLRQVAPELPEPDFVKHQKWRYSQIHRAYEGTPGCVIVKKSPLLILTGDAFLHSNLDGCIGTSLITARTLKELLT